MGKKFEPDMDGKDQFHDTCWGDILDYQTSNAKQKKIILKKLISKYWKPVYHYLRNRGCDCKTSQILTKSFFREIIIGRDFISKVNKDKGKFRTYLITALNRYLIKAPPRSPLVIFDDIVIPLKDHSITPEEEALLLKTIAEVRQEFKQLNKEIYWNVYSDKILTPILENKKPPSLKDICKKYNITTEAKVMNMIAIVKRQIINYIERNLPPEEPSPVSTVKSSPIASNQSSVDHSEI